MGNYIGIDLGGTSVKFGIISASGEILKQWNIPTVQGQIVEDIVASIRENADLSEIEGIGMGSPGVINYETGTVKGAYNLGWADETPVKEIIERELQKTTIIENDANVAALGEQWVGAGENADNVVLVTLGTGVGGGVIVGGQLQRGVAGAAGEIGHMCVEIDGYECTCGNRGCLEQYAAATGLTNIARHYGYAAQFETAKEIMDAAQKLNPNALEIVAKFASSLGLALANIANILNPSYIVIGGGVSAAGDYLIQIVEAHFREHAYPGVKHTTKLRIAQLGNDAGILGAARLAGAGK
ncbi:MAG: ROK family glucokinase [Lactobacillales bacterium]|nr:ROK family glucokinase [Lactobacillales bacterium]